MPEVTIIVPTRNRAEMLRRTAPLLLAQSGGSFEIIYADDGSTDDTAEVLESLAKDSGGTLRMLRTNGLGPGAARNRAARAAEGPWLLFTDDDVEPPGDWAMAMVRHARECGADAVSSRVVGTETDSPVARYLGQRIEQYLGTEPRELRVAPMMSFAISREAFERVGGFSERPLLALEDWDFCHRLRAVGGTIRYTPDITVRHHYAEEFAGAARRMALTGATASYLAKEWYSSPALYFLYSTAAWLASPVSIAMRFPPSLYVTALRLEWVLWRSRAQWFFAPGDEPPS